MPATTTSSAERFVAATIAKEIDLGYTPFPKQQAFHASPAKYRLFGGAAGPGKTKALLMEAILQAHENPGVNTLLLRRTFPELEQSLLLYFRRDVPRELYKSFSESKHIVEWQNGSTTRFGYCATESDVYQYQGAEFLFIGIDELTMFTLRQWQFLTSRNRCPVPGTFPCMAGATNPGNIGHAWVKSLWIDRRPAPGMEDAAYDPADYDFIPARIYDNPIYERDQSYLKSLRALPTHLRRAFLDGDWDVFAGQYFDNFDYSRHVIRPEHIRGPQVPGEGSLGDQWKLWWPRWISIDWGFEHPAAVYWHAALPPGATSSLSGSPGAPSFAPSAKDGQVEARDSSPATSPCSTPRQAGAANGGAKAPHSTHTPSDHPWRDGIHSPTVPVEGQGFSPATKRPAEPNTVLPEAVAEGAGPQRQQDDSPEQIEGKRDPSPGENRNRRSRDDDPGRIVTYREYVTRHTSPRDLAREIIARSLLSSPSPDTADSRRGHSFVEERGTGPAVNDGREAPSRVQARDFSPATNRRAGDPSFLPEAIFSGPRERTSSSSVPDFAREKIDAIYLSPDAFARRTDELSIADQMGDIFAAAGLPRPVPADDDRVGGWMLMYQLLSAGEWLITENCVELIRTLPNLVRDQARVEDIEKMDGDDPADAARYGLKSRFAARLGDPGGWRSRMPLADRLAAHAYSADPTIHALQARKFLLDESRGRAPVRFLHRRR